MGVVALLLPCAFFGLLCKAYGNSEIHNSCLYAKEMERKPQPKQTLPHWLCNSLSRACVLAGMNPHTAICSAYHFIYLKKDYLCVLNNIQHCGEIEQKQPMSTKISLRWNMVHNHLICSFACFSSLSWVHFISCVHKETICLFFLAANVWQRNQNKSLFFKKNVGENG